MDRDASFLRAWAARRQALDGDAWAGSAFSGDNVALSTGAADRADL